MRREVRLFVLVLCPRTGNPFKWRLPLKELISINLLIFKLIKRFKSPSNLNSSFSKISRNADMFVSVKSETFTFSSMFTCFRILQYDSQPALELYGLCDSRLSVLGNTLVLGTKARIIFANG